MSHDYSIILLHQYHCSTILLYLSKLHILQCDLRQMKKAIEGRCPGPWVFESTDLFVEYAFGVGDPSHPTPNACCLKHGLAQHRATTASMGAQRLHRNRSYKKLQTHGPAPTQTAKSQTQSKKAGAGRKRQGILQSNQRCAVSPSQPKPSRSHRGSRPQALLKMLCRVHVNRVFWVDCGADAVKASSAV